jgi:hypothetical protein
MADVLAHASTFGRGSNVLEYWLLNAEGFTVEPLGATVDRVVVPAPFEPPVALVVHDGRGRERVISVDSIAAVEPREERLLLDPRARVTRRKASAASLRRARAVFAWLSPRVLRAASASARHAQDGYAWLRPRVVIASRWVAAETVQMGRRALRCREACYEWYAASKRGRTQ